MRCLTAAHPGAGGDPATPGHRTDAGTVPGEGHRPPRASRTGVTPRVRWPRVPSLRTRSGERLTFLAALPPVFTSDDSRSYFKLLPRRLDEPTQPSERTPALLQSPAAEGRPAPTGKKSVLRCQESCGPGHREQSHTCPALGQLDALTF